MSVFVGWKRTDGEKGGWVRWKMEQMDKELNRRMLYL